MQSETDPILLITTGGTIAAESYKGQPTPKDVTVVSNATVINQVRDLTSLSLAQARDGLRNGDFSAVQLATAFIDRLNTHDMGCKDSKYITDEDVHSMAETIVAAPEEFVLVTCGTDAMASIARKLKSILSAEYPDILSKKSIVFTGAMKPLSHGKDGSDGFQNLQDAYEVMRHNARKGIVVVMNRMVFNPDRMDKVYTKGYEGVFIER